MIRFALTLIFLLLALVPAGALTFDALPSYQDAGMKLYVRGTQKLQDGDFVGAADDLRQAVRSRPDLAEAFHNLGFAFEKTGNAKGAAAAYERALALRPNYASALNNLGFLLATNETDVQRAVQLCQRAVELEPRSASYRDSLGWACYKAGRVTDATLHFQAAIRLDPTFFKAYFNLGLAEFSQKRFAEATQAFSQTIRLNPNYIRAYIPLGACLEQAQQKNKALHVYQQALTKAPEGSPVRRHLEKRVKELSASSKNYYFQNVKQLQGSSRLHEFMQRRPRNGRLHPQLDTPESNGTGLETNSAFTPVSVGSTEPQGLALMPGTPSSIRGSFSSPASVPNPAPNSGASMGTSQSTFSSAAMTVAPASGQGLTVRQERELEKRFNLSKSYLDRGLVQEAKAELERIIAQGGETGIGRQARSQLLRVEKVLDEKTRKNARTHLDMGKDFFRSGKYDMAEVEFQKSLSLEPQNAEAHKDLALLYYNQGRLRDAYEQSKKAIALDRSLKEAYVVLGSLYAKKGRSEEAIQVLRRVREVSQRRDAVDDLADRMINTLQSGS
jgi:Flp pilus assembly protein TadD